MHFQSVFGIPFECRSREFYKIKTSQKQLPAAAPNWYAAKVDIGCQVPLAVAIVRGNGNAINFGGIFTAANHAVGTITHCQIEPGWKARFLRQAIFQIQAQPVGLTIVIFKWLLKFGFTKQ